MEPSPVDRLPQPSATDRESGSSSTEDGLPDLSSPLDLSPAARLSATGSPPANPAAEYRALIDRLARLPAALDAERERIDRWHDGQLRDAEATVERAANAVREMEAEAVGAKSTLDWTHAESHRLWRDLKRRVGRLGPPPPPALYVDPDDDPLRLLREVVELLGPRPAPRSRPTWLAPVLMAVGAVAAAGTVVLIALLLARAA